MVMLVNMRPNVVTIGTAVVRPTVPVEVSEEWMKNETVQQMLKDGHLKVYEETSKTETKRAPVKKE